MLTDNINRHFNTPLGIRKLEALADTQAKISFYDINDGGDDLRKLLIQVGSLIHDIRAAGEGENQSRAEIINTIAFENIREWFMTGQFGYQVARICQNDPALQNKLINKQLRVFLSAGSTHADLVRKLNMFKVNTESFRPKNEEPNEVNELVAKGISDCSVSEAELSRAIGKNQ